jgi:ribosomal protein L11 methyltransferase
MILWQKRASADWLRVNEPRLQEIARCDLAIIARPGHVRTLVQVTCHRREKSVELLRAFGGSAKPRPRNWSSLTRSRQMHPPIRIGRRLEIVEETRSPQPNGKLRLVVPAAGAFGTGEHATTAMSLRLLEEVARNRPPGWRLLDAGTGTGILALAAHFLGARDVLGIDNDPRAIAHARKNALLNHIDGVKFLNCDLLAWKSRTRYDLIAANLFSETLIAAFPGFRRGLRATGRIIISGILLEQERVVVSALRRTGFALEQLRRRGKWIALLAGIDSSSALSKRNCKP